MNPGDLIPVPFYDIDGNETHRVNVVVVSVEQDGYAVRFPNLTLNCEYAVEPDPHKSGEVRNIWLDAVTQAQVFYDPSATVSSTNYLIDADGNPVSDIIPEVSLAYQTDATGFITFSDADSFLTP